MILEYLNNNPILRILTLLPIDDNYFSLFINIKNENFLIEK